MSAPQQIPLALNREGGSPEASAQPSLNPAQQNDGRSAPAPVWLQRVSLAVLVMFCLYLGLLIAILPWWKDMWDRNPLLAAYPALRSILTQGPVRGLISGLGVLDLWIGISELIHYRDYRN